MSELLRRSDFRRWLESFPPEAHVGFSNHGFGTEPICEFLRAQGYRCPFLRGWRRVTFGLHGDQETHDLPEWAIDFLFAAQGQPAGVVTAAFALTVLESLDE